MVLVVVLELLLLADALSSIGLMEAGGAGTKNDSKKRCYFHVLVMPQELQIFCNNLFYCYLQKAISTVIQYLGLQLWESQIQKVIQFYYQIIVSVTNSYENYHSYNFRNMLHYHLSKEIL